MSFLRRISEGWKSLGLEFIPIHEQEGFTDPDDADIVWVLKDAWTTYNGSWQPNGDTWDVPDWAIQDYQLPWEHECRFDDAGADHHIFGACLPVDYDGGNVGCQLIDGAGIVYWSDERDFPQPSDPLLETKAKSGWANNVMYASSNFDPEVGQGPWKWMKVGIADIAKGAGMPHNHHVSFFVVWQEMTWEDYKELFLENGNGNGNGENDLEQQVRELQQRVEKIESWIRSFE